MMMAAALKRCYDKQTHFGKKISVEEQRAQKDNRFLRGRQIAYLIYDYFRPPGSYDEIQGLSGLLSMELENDDIQDFDFYVWSKALLLTVDPPSDKVLEGLHVSKLQDSSQAQTIVALYNQEILRGGKRDYHRPRMCMKLHIEQAQRSNNFRIQSEDCRACCRNSRKGAKFLHQAEDSCSFLHSRASGNRETSAGEVKDTGVSNLKPAVNNEQRRKGKGQASSSVPTGKGQTDVKSSASRDASPATRAKIPCLWVARCERPSCYFRHPSVCREYKCGKRCIYGKSCLYRHADGREKPSKKSKKESTQGAVAILKEKKVQGCASQNSDPKKSIMRKAGQKRLSASAGHTIKFSGRTWYQIQMRERKRTIPGRYPKRWTSWAKSLRAQVWGKNTWGNLKTRRVCPQSSMGFGEKFFKVKAEDKSYVPFSCGNKGTGASLQKKQEGRMFCGWFGSFNVHAEQEGFKLRWNW